LNLLMLLCSIDLHKPVYMKKKLIIGALIVIVLAVVGVWYFIFYSPVHNRFTVDNKKGVGVTATDIAKEFTTNEAAATTKYNNKVLEISGEVDHIDADSTGGMVFLKTGDPNTMVSCRLRAPQGVQPGTTVTVKGVFTGFILNEVQLNEAVITSGATAAPTPTVYTPPSTIAPKDNTNIKPVTDTVKPAVPAQPAVPVAKVFKSNKASIRFFSSTPAEDIEATNTQVISTLDEKSGAIVFAALIKGFRFDNELMQKHFNDDKYMNSEKFPKAEFKGDIINIASVDLHKDGTYPATAEGSLTIHGVTKKAKATGTITVSGGKLNLKSVFKIHVQDYGVDGSEVAENVEITVNCSYN